MNHYGLLEKEQKEKWKAMAKEAYTMNDDEEQDGKKSAQTYGPVNFDHFLNRNEKIALFKRKKEIEQHLDMLRDYKDEETKRNYYMMQLCHSIVKSLE